MLKPYPFMEDAAMLRDNTSSAPDSETKAIMIDYKESKDVTLTTEDFETFYRLIAKSSYNKFSSYADVLILLRKSYYEFITAVLLNKKILSAKKSIMNSQIDMLKEKDFFEHQFDLKKLALLKKDIHDDGKALKIQIPQDDRKDFILLLNNITDEYENSLPQENTVPATLKTGISSIEQASIIQNVTFFHSLPSLTLCDRGNEFLKKREWEKASELFASAIAAEYEIANELKTSANEHNILIYKQNLMYAIKMKAIALQNDGEFTEAIETYQRIITIYNNLPKYVITKKIQEFLRNIYRQLAITFDLLAIKNFNEEDIDNAIAKHKDAIATLQKIDPSFMTEEDDFILSNFQRNLIFVLNEQGDDNNHQKSYETAIKNYQEALDILCSIKPEQTVKADIEMADIILEKLRNLLDEIQAILDQQIKEEEEKLAEMENTHGFFHHASTASALSTESRKRKCDEEKQEDELPCKIQRRHL